MAAPVKDGFRRNRLGVAGIAKLCYFSDHMQIHFRDDMNKPLFTGKLMFCKNELSIIDRVHDGSMVSEHVQR